MNTRHAIAARGAPRCGSAAVVTYLPAPLGPVLTALRQNLDSGHNPEAHVTFLPPRELSVEVGLAATHIERVIRNVEPFEVELGCVNVFPKTNILYLNIHAGYESLVSLHAALNQGILQSEESFEFIPHLTLSGPLVLHEIEAILKRAEAAWEALRHPHWFRVTDVTLLHQPSTTEEHNWTRFATYQLGKASGAVAVNRT